ncbi:phosphoadenosine phosphosulfate reductase family protein [Metasolibacillus sp.]|uniref:phosphoadenosine phosphosulfate reductase domain-containing protein n=1 Tax=Metasolibacillus sp. TaxID=2703680 RepID=UPI0025FCC455|nr:phosphoadenosine phosphosulfate reductase family protein [Metasolibacillus sp.]MCT6926346.1 phosphoadenosine phosphosulfate reductase family protein [Metasolibacillus sp.]MCT6942607.1 phosphoadenosine phosphosulfate reductase family protein [Metasolibacillus sp.]
MNNRTITRSKRGENMIKQNYDDGKKHVHVLSFGGGTQSTALLLMALKGEINGVIPDYIIFSDTGWEPSNIYKWVDKVNGYIKQKYGHEIIFTNGGNIREDFIKAAETGSRVATMPLFTLADDGSVGMIRRQCTGEYKIEPVKRKVRELLGYKPRQQVKEVVHMWKGISTDEIHRVKSIEDKWIEAEHPLIDVRMMNRTNCISYVEREGLGTPAKSSCIGCPFHDNQTWLEMKRNDPQSFADACFIDEKIRHMPVLNGQAFLHRSCKPLREVDLNENQLELDLWANECEGMCGL